ncbi:MAG: hypothetical protein ACK5JT_15460 [Hyphomicrobiaceae bacterium]
MIRKTWRFTLSSPSLEFEEVDCLFQAWPETIRRPARTRPHPDDKCPGYGY